MNDDVLLRAFNKFAQGRHRSAPQAREVVDFVGANAAVLQNVAAIEKAES